MTYTLTAHPNTIVRDEDGAFIPTDPDNMDYQDYLAWLDEGNEPTPYTPPPAPEGEDNRTTTETRHPERAPQPYPTRTPGGTFTASRTARSAGGPTRNLARALDRSEPPASVKPSQHSRAPTPVTHGPARGTPKRTGR